MRQTLGDSSRDTSSSGSGGPAGTRPRRAWEPAGKGQNNLPRQGPLREPVALGRNLPAPEPCHRGRSASVRPTLEVGGHANALAADTPTIPYVPAHLSVATGDTGAAVTRGSLRAWPERPPAPGTWRAIREDRHGHAVPSSAGGRSGPAIPGRKDIGRPGRPRPGLERRCRTARWPSGWRTGLRGRKTLPRRRMNGKAGAHRPLASFAHSSMVASTGTGHHRARHGDTYRHPRRCRHTEATAGPSADAFRRRHGVSGQLGDGDHAHDSRSVQPIGRPYVLRCGQVSSARRWRLERPQPLRS